MLIGRRNSIFISCVLFAATLFLNLPAAFFADQLDFPPTYRLLEKDTYQAAVQSLQLGDKVALQNLINRDPLVARKVLIELLRQPDKQEMARFMAELFPESCEGEVEKPLFDFFLAGAPDTRKRLLDLVAMITDAEYAIQHVQRIDDFENRLKDQALSYLHQAAVDFDGIGFVDGEAYSLARSAIYGGRFPSMDSGLEKMKEALTLYEKSTNVRGQVICLMQMARLNHQRVGDKGKADQLFLLACDKGKIEGSPILRYFLSQYSWLAEKTSTDWLNESKAILQNQSGLRSTRYQLLLQEDTPVEKYRALLAEEPDPILRVRAHWTLFQNLSENDRQKEAVEEADAAIELARLQHYDMAAYGGSFHPPVPSLLIARAYSKIQLGMLRAAENDCLEALRLLDQEKSQSVANYLEPVKISALDRLSKIYGALGEYPLAIERAHESLTLSQPRKAGDSIYYSYVFLAQVHSEMGELRQAEDYLEKAAQTHLPSNPAPIHMAQLHLNFQLYEESLRDLNREQEVLEQFFKVRPQARPYLWWVTERLRLLTEVWLRLGEPEKALVTAMELEERKHPVEQGMMGMALMALGRYPEAEKYFQARLESLKGATWPQKEVDAVLNLGKICHATKRSGEASRYFQRALELYRQIGDRRGELDVLLEMAQLAFNLNDLRTSEISCLQALTLANELQDLQGVWTAQYRLAKIALSREQKEKAIEHLEASVEAVETVSGNIKVDIYKTGFLEDKIQVFDELIALLGPMDPGKAFYYTEKRKARAFLESSRRAGLISTALPNNLRQRKEEMEARLVGKQRALLEQLSKPANDRNTSLIQLLQKDLKQIRDEHTQLLKTIELDASTGNVARKEISTVTASRVQQDVLRPAQALVEYVVRDQETYLFLVTRQNCKFYRLPITRRELARRIERLQLPFSQFREGKIDLLHLSYDVKLSYALYRLLFQPIDSALQPGTEIIVVPDDVLNFLPFESLARTEEIGPTTTDLPFEEYQNVDWLVKHFTFTYALSATSLRLRPEQAGSTPQSLLAFSNNSIGGSQKNEIERVVLRGSLKSGEKFPEFPPLPQAAKESKLIGELMSGKLRTKVFLGNQATESEFYKEALTADYLHFAVHSLVNQEEPYYSALVLAPEKNSDGLLQAYEIVNTRLKSRLVTLSSCETALGKLKRGEGMLGLQRAFLQAGAESVVVSLWSIEDSTANFMEAFYKFIRDGQNLSMAIRNAKLQYLKETLALGGGQRFSLSHPFFWAPFVLTTTALDSR